MKHLIALILSLFAISAQAQSTELAPQHTCYLNGVVTYGDCWQASNWPALNTSVSAPGGVLTITSRTAGIGGAKSTAPKVSPLKAKWSAYKPLESGTYLARWTVLMTCPAAANEHPDQAVLLNVGPMATLTHYSQFTSGVPREFVAQVSYTRIWPQESVYFTFGLNANPPKDAYGKPQYGCKYSLTNLSLTTAALIQQ